MTTKESLKTGITIKRKESIGNSFQTIVRGYENIGTSPDGSQNTLHLEGDNIRRPSCIDPRYSDMSNRLESTDDASKFLRENCSPACIRVNFPGTDHVMLLKVFSSTACQHASICPGKTVAELVAEGE